MKEEKLETKREVFKTLLEIKKKQYNEIKKFQEEQLSSINDADLDRSEMIESQTENMMREMRVESASLDHLKEEINYLEDYNSFMDRDTVGPSTIVKTTKANYVVSVAEKSFTVQGDEYYGISTKSPVYQALKDKKEGDEVEFNGDTLKITTVA